MLRRLVLIARCQAKHLLGQGRLSADLVYSFSATGVGTVKPILRLIPAGSSLLPRQCCRRFDAPFARATMNRSRGSVPV